MTPEGETSLFKRLETMAEKQDEILVCLTGKPLDTPPVPGLVQMSQSHGQRLGQHEESITKVEKWQGRATKRIWFLAGIATAVGWFFDRAYEYFTSAHK